VFIYAIFTDFKKSENNEDFLNQASHFFLAFGNMVRKSEIATVFTDFNLKVQAIANAKLRILINRLAVFTLKVLFKISSSKKQIKKQKT